MKSRSFFLSIAVAIAVGNPALAAPVAVIHDASGSVSVQSSKGVSSAAPGAGLSNGDRIITGPEGSAVVSYLNGKCAGKHKIPPRSIATLSKEACVKVAGADGVPSAQGTLGIPDDVALGIGAAGLIGGISAGLASTSGGGGPSSGTLFVTTSVSP